MMLNTIFLLYCMKLSHINHDEKIYTAVFLNFILTSRIKVVILLMGIFSTCTTLTYWEGIYGDTSAMYVCAVFLSTYAVALIVNNDNNFSVLLAVLCLVCSMGMYQSHVIFSLCLLYILFFKKILERKDFDYFLLKKAILLFILGLLIYFLVVKIVLICTGSDSFICMCI